MSAADPEPRRRRRPCCGSWATSWPCAARPSGAWSTSSSPLRRGRQKAAAQQLGHRRRSARPWSAPCGTRSGGPAPRRPRCCGLCEAPGTFEG
ncbi:hypothetical protein QJS66_10125 [Kocuria rhizophila]|nr:hypothetical protein QJS66_10125 [Kocuria rhizophila]